MGDEMEERCTFSFTSGASIAVSDCFLPLRDLLVEGSGFTLALAAERLARVVAGLVAALVEVETLMVCGIISQRGTLSLKMGEAIYLARRASLDIGIFDELLRLGCGLAGALTLCRRGAKT